MQNLNANLGEQMNLIAQVPLDMAGASGLNAGWVSTKNYQRVSVLLVCAAGGAAEPPTITLQQATDVSGTSAKNAAIITKVFKKEHATALEGVGTWTEVNQAAAATFLGTAQVQAAYLFDVRPEDLDNDNAFDCIRATVADVGATAKFGSLMYIGWGARYEPPLTMVAN